MSIQWYPGHMTKARRELASVIPAQDVIIEVLDARLPAASENPVVTELRGQKPCIKVLTKSDLADPQVTAAWLRHYAAAPGRVAAFASTTDRPAETRTRIVAMCEQLGIHPRQHKPVRAVIAGSPNVGKSTLINTLMNRVVANVGDKPAVTKGQQQVVLASGMVIADTPGILWPDIEDELTGLKLGLGGMIPDTAIDYLTVAMFGAELFLTRYPALLMARFNLREAPTTAEGLLAGIGRRRGCLQSGGSIDLHKASGILVHEFRSGSLGRISLEEPAGHGAGRVGGHSEPPAA